MSVEYDYDDPDFAKEMKWRRDNDRTPVSVFYQKPYRKPPRFFHQMGPVVTRRRTRKSTPAKPKPAKDAGIDGMTPEQLQAEIDTLRRLLEE